MIGETGCCGFSMEEKGPNLFGLLTLAVPMLLAAVVAWPFLYIISGIAPATKRIKHLAQVIIRANLNLIHKKQFLPLYRCKLAGTMFGVSPQFSGIIYKNFNLTILLMIWIGIFFPIVVWLK